MTIKQYSVLSTLSSTKSKTPMFNPVDGNQEEDVILCEGSDTDLDTSSESDACEPAPRLAQEDLITLHPEQSHQSNLQALTYLTGNIQNATLHLQRWKDSNGEMFFTAGFTFAATPPEFGSNESYVETAPRWKFDIIKRKYYSLKHKYSSLKKKAKKARQ